MSWFFTKQTPRPTLGGIKYRDNGKHKKNGWGRRWIDCIARFSARNRLERGLRYAKSGQVISLHIEPGSASAEIQGTHNRPYKVEIGLPLFTRKQLLHVTAALLKKAFFAAKLLAGTMPDDIESIFGKAGASLFPTSETDFSSDCSCPDTENPCKHVAATCYILAQEFDRDPFLLLEMRGLSRAQLLSEIQTRRTKKNKPSMNPSSDGSSMNQPTQTPLSDRLNNFFESPKEMVLSQTTEPNRYPQFIKPGSRIHEMGLPPFWQSDNDFETILTRIYQAIRKRVMERTTQ